MPIKKFNADLLPKLRKLDVYARQNVLSETLEGNWTAVFKGQGMEFSGYRSYTFGDDASLIDWKASLRSKSLLVKEYETEKSANVYFLFDVSNTMLFSSTGKLKAEYAAEMISSMSFAILKSGDAVGLSLFNDKLVTRLPLNIGKRMHFFIVKDLSNPKNYGGNFDFNNVLKLLFSVMKRNAVLIIVSDFINMNPGWYKYLNIASQRYEVIGIMVRDPRDRDLPKDAGQFVLQDPYTNEKILIDAADYAEPYRKFVEQEEKEIEKHFKAIKSDLLKLTTDEEFFRPLMKFFKKRALVKR